MAVVTYTQGAVLGAYQNWLMEQGAQACLQQVIKDQDPPKRPSAMCGPYAQAGSSIRYTVSTTLSSANVFFSGQFLTDTGKWTDVGETITATSAGGVKQIVRPATAGSYANMVASVGAAVVGAGEVYVVAELGRQNNGGFVPYAVLFKGYPESNEPMDMCSGTFVQNKPSSGGGGCCITTQYEDVATGTTSINYTITPGAGQAARVILVETGLVTDATAITRQVLVFYQVGGLYSPYQNVPALTQGASLTQKYVWQIGGTPRNSLIDVTYYDLLPQDLWISQAFDVRVQAYNVQSGDDFAATTIVWELKGP